MLILKTGIQKRHEEQSEYKNLVWVGDAANIASKLTDSSNKEYNSPLYKLSYIDFGFENVFKGYEKPVTQLDRSLYGDKGKEIYKNELVTKTRYVTLTIEEFAKKVDITADGWKYDGKKVTTIDKENRSGTTSPILMSGKVYAEFKKAAPKSSFVPNFSQRQYPNTPFTGSGVFGGYGIYSDITQIKL
jgi:hypothetical protein